MLYYNRYRQTLYQHRKLCGLNNYLRHFSGGDGYTVGKSIGFGYVLDPQGINKTYLKSGEYSLEVAAQGVLCKIHLSLLYDPQMKNIKA